MGQNYESVVDRSGEAREEKRFVGCEMGKIGRLDDQRKSLVCSLGGFMLRKKEILTEQKQTIVTLLPLC